MYVDEKLVMNTYNIHFPRKIRKNVNMVAEKI